jgi:hypothetical protein
MLAIGWSRPESPTIGTLTAGVDLIAHELVLSQAPVSRYAFNACKENPDIAFGIGDGAKPPFLMPPPDAAGWHIRFWHATGLQITDSADYLAGRGALPAGLPRGEVGHERVTAVEWADRPRGTKELDDVGLEIGKAADEQGFLLVAFTVLADNTDGLTSTGQLNAEQGTLRLRMQPEPGFDVRARCGRDVSGDPSCGLCEDLGGVNLLHRPALGHPAPAGNASRR